MSSGFSNHIDSRTQPAAPTGQKHRMLRSGPVIHGATPRAFYSKPSRVCLLSNGRNDEKRRSDANQHMKRRTFLAFAAAALLPLFPSIASAKTKTLRLGIFAIGPRDAGYLAAFEKRLRELNYVEGHNLDVEFVRVAGPDGFDQAARELVRREGDVILPSGPAAA